MAKNDTSLPLVGGIAAAIGAGPLVLLLLGVSGPWIGNLTGLEPCALFLSCWYWFYLVLPVGKFIDL